MAPFSRGLFRIATSALFIVILITVSFFHPSRVTDYTVYQRAIHQKPLSDFRSPLPSSNNPSLYFNRPNLTEEECRNTFPNLFTAIDAAVARGNFTFTPSPPDYTGLIQARIIDNNLHILTTSPSTIPQTIHQRTAILSQLHRALLTSPSLLPNIHFSFTVNDVPKNNSWGFSLPNKNSSYNTWIMPSFAHWSWPAHNLGSMSEVLARIERVEASTPWREKIDKVVWRGTPWFNPIGHPELRKDLVKVAKGKEWADVVALDGANSSKAMPIENFCGYKYVVYTEGVSYSGRLPYHQACESVLIMAPLTWLTTSALLVRPITAEMLMGKGIESERKGLGLLPTVARIEDANVVYVKPDFSDLEEVVKFLRERPDVAQKIARNQQDTLIGGGYLSLAAETCYWRALILGWSRVAMIDETDWNDNEGERYETWLLKEVSRPNDGSKGKSTEKNRV